MKDHDETLRVTQEQFEEMRKSSYDFGYASYKRAWEEQLGKATNEALIELNSLKSELERYKAALIKIDNECGLDDTKAWSIAVEALKGEKS